MFNIIISSPYDATRIITKISKNYAETNQKTTKL